LEPVLKGQITSASKAQTKDSVKKGRKREKSIQEAKK
jgi:hypothetical protein